MTPILASRTWRNLRATAHAHGLPFHTRHTKAQAYDRLYHALITGGVLRRRLKWLSADERQVLVALQAAGGALPLHNFQRAFGQVRVWRPWRADTPKHPWKQPVSVAEKLWYLGFIEIVQGRPDRAVLPDEVLALLPPLLQIEPTAPVTTETTASCDTLCGDIAALLGVLLFMDVRPLHGRWLPLGALRTANRRLSAPESLAGKRSESQTGRLRFLHYLAEAAGLVAVQAGVLKPTMAAWDWLRLAPPDRWQSLWEAVKADLQARGRLWDRYRLPPVDARTWAVVREHLKPGSYHLSSFIASLHPHLPGVDDLDTLCRALMEGPLTWAGEIALNQDRVTIAPRLFFAPQPATLKQQADHLDIILPSVPRLPALVSCCAWAQAEGHTLRVDQDAVIRALEAGMDPLHMASALADLIGAPLPAAAFEQITIWTHAAQSLTLRHVTLLTGESDMLAALRADWRLRPLLGEPLSPHHMLIPTEQRDELLTKLARRGHRVTHHTTPATPPEPAALSPDMAAYLWLAVRVYQKLGAFVPLDTPVPAVVRDWLTAQLPAGRADSLETTSQGIMDQLAHTLRGHAAASPVASHDDPAAVQAAVQAAYDQRDALTIEYFSPARGEKTVRTIEPVMLYERGGAAYVEAWCQLDNATRTFRLDRIMRIVHDGLGS
jgi:hypothetical protein